MTNQINKKSVIPNELLAPLGRVISNFSFLENNIDFAIWLLLMGNYSTEQRTCQIVTSELTFKNKIALFSSLYQHRFPDKKPYRILRHLLKKLSEANNKRNDLVHSTWCTSGGKFKYRAKEKNGFEFKFQKINVEQINEVADFIYDVAYETLTFYTSF